MGCAPPPAGVLRRLSLLLFPPTPCFDTRLLDDAAALSEKR